MLHTESGALTQVSALTRHIFLIVLLWLCTVPVVADETAALWQRLQHARECYNRGLPDSAMIQARELLPKLLNHGNMVMLAMDYVVIGTVYSDRDDKQAALKEYDKVARIAEKYDFLEQAKKPKLKFLYQTMIPVYALLTTLSEDLGHYEQSRDYASKGAEWVQQHGDPGQFAVAVTVFTEAQNSKPDEKHSKDESPELIAMKQKATADTSAAHNAALEKERDGTNVKSDSSEKPTGVRTIVRYVSLNGHRFAWAVTGLVIVVLLFLGYVVWQRHVGKKRKRETEQQMDERYMEGQEEERNRLARELHDGISNQLLAVEMKLNADGNSPQTLQLLGESREMVRRISHGLIAPEFERTTIDQALSSYAAQMCEMGQMEVCFVAKPADAEWDTIDPRTAHEVYRIVQEAVGNAMKHANATLVSIGLHRTANGLVVDVSDDGGLNNNGNLNDDNKLNENSTGIGHRTMSQRAALISGKIEVFRHPYGTTLRLTVTNKSAPDES